MSLDHAIEAAAKAVYAAWAGDDAPLATELEDCSSTKDWTPVVARIAVEAAGPHLYADAQASTMPLLLSQKERAERAEAEVARLTGNQYADTKLMRALQRAEKAGTEVERLQSQTMFWEDRANNTEEAFMDERNLCNELGWMLQHIATYGTNSVAKPQITDLVERFRKTR